MLPKFRAWDKNNAYMECTDKNLTVVFAQEGIQVVDHTTFSSSCTNMEDYVLMQSTGLKDKNDKEIFEGDILSVSKNHNKTDSRVFNDEKVNYRVEFLNYDDMEAYADIEHYGWCATGSIDKWSTRCTLIDAVKLWDAEIMGNKFEHPHLLEEE